MTEENKCKSVHKFHGAFFKCSLDEEHGGQHEFLIVWDNEDSF